MLTNDPHASQRGIERLQRRGPLPVEILSEKDRMELREAIRYLNWLRDWIPMTLTLSELGRQLHAEGKITLAWGDSYSQAALEYVLTEQGLTPPRAQAPDEQRLETP